MENRDDILIADFLKNHRMEISDNEFSKRVMNHLPAPYSRKTYWIIPLFALIGFVISLYIIDFSAIYFEISDFIISIPLYQRLIGLMIFPIVFLLFYLNWGVRGFQVATFKLKMQLFD